MNKEMLEEIENILNHNNDYKEHYHLYTNFEVEHIDILLKEYQNLKHFLGIKDIYYIVNKKQNYYEVIPETICQGTILKNGLEIFEGDIYHHGDTNITYTVVWHDSSLIGKQNKSSSYAGLEAWADRIQIIGNIFDNKEFYEEVK